MNPWLAALIPLGIMVLLGPLAFFFGYRRYISDQPGNGDVPDNPQPRQPISASNHAALAQQRELRRSLATSDRLVSRAPDERAVLVQYIDPAAPHSAGIYAYLRELRNEFGDRITFAARHFPSTGQTRSSAALEAAGRQGKLYELLDGLYADDPPRAERGSGPGQSASDTALLVRLRGIAQELGLDMTRYDADIADRQTSRVIDADKQEALAAGIRCAPSFLLLDGYEHNATSLDEFRQVVTEAAQR